MLPTNQSAGLNFVSIANEEEDGLADSAVSRHDYLRHVRKILGKASEDQQSLADAREKLLVQRERWKKARLLLYQQRVETGDVEASFMSSLRAFYHETRHDLSPAFDTAYRKVTEARDKLGQMEEDFLRDEQHLTHFEWVFTEKESDFYQFDIQDLITEATYNIKEGPSSDTHTNTVPKPLISIEAIDAEYKAALEELDRLKESFDGLRRERGALLSDELTAQIGCHNATTHKTKTLDLDQEASNVLDKIAMSQVKAQKLKVISMQCEKLALIRRNSEPAVEHSKSSTPMKRANTDSHVRIIAQQVDSEQYIGEWLSEAVQYNRLGVNLVADDSEAGQVGPVDVEYYPSGAQVLESIEGEERLFDPNSESGESSQKADQDSSSNQLHKTERMGPDEAVGNTPPPLDGELLLGLSSDLLSPPMNQLMDESGSTNVPLLRLESADSPEGSELDSSIDLGASDIVREGLDSEYGAKIEQSPESPLLFTENLALAPPMQNTDLPKPPCSSRYDSGNRKQASDEGNDETITPSLSTAQSHSTQEQVSGNLDTVTSQRATNQNEGKPMSSARSGSSSMMQHEESHGHFGHTTVTLGGMRPDDTMFASTTRKDDPGTNGNQPETKFPSTHDAQVATAYTYRRPPVSTFRYQRSRPLSDHGAAGRHIQPLGIYNTLRSGIQQRRSRSSSDASSLCRSEHTIDTQIAHDTSGP